MPLIYRVMTRDGNKPKVGNSARTLGVRVPPNSEPDVVPKADGTVEPGMGGMSVSPDVYSLPAHRLPKRYDAYVPKAHGKEQDVCWRMGEGSFIASDVAVGLTLRIDHPGHAFVEPGRVMPLTEYQLALEATRDAWIIVEP